MQENRSFDHYFGTLGGVRGFADPKPSFCRSSGNPVWYKTIAAVLTLPFHPLLRISACSSLKISRTTGRLRMAPGTSETTIVGCPTAGPSYRWRIYTRRCPFRAALADAFTICDAYHCSSLDPPITNRYHMWTGWTGNDGKERRPGSPKTMTVAESWSTFPEQQEKMTAFHGKFPSGIRGWDWMQTHDCGEGRGQSLCRQLRLKSLLLFDQYQQAEPGPFI